MHTHFQNVQRALPAVVNKAVIIYNIPLFFVFYSRLTSTEFRSKKLCIHYTKGPLDVFILLQASPQQTKMQQEDADRAMKERITKSIAKDHWNQRREKVARREKPGKALP